MRLLSSLLVVGLTTSAAGQNADWTPAAGLGSGRVSVLKTNDVKPSVLWAGGSGGVYVSKDAGASWTLKTASLPDPFHIGVPYRALDADRRNPETVYATVGEILYRTFDGGNTWAPPRPASPGNFLVGPDILIVLDPVHPGDFYAEFRNDSVCWASTASSHSSCAYSFGGTFAIDPTNTDIFYAGGGGPLKSTDSGNTWAYLLSPIQQVTYVRVDDSGAVWIGGYDSSYAARILKSADGGASWTDLSRGLPGRGTSLSAATVNEIAPSPTNPMVLVAAVSQAYGDTRSPHPDSGFYRSVDGGAGWYRLGGYFEALTVAFAGANSETLVGGTALNGVVTTDANPPAAPISVGSITPETGSTEGGTIVLISGSGFTPGAFVEIGGRPTTDFWFFDSSTIRVRTTAHAVGLGDVVVHNADGGVAAKANAFGFENWAGPTLFSPSPCDPGQGLCLENGRFRVIVSGHAVALSQKSGYYWFDYSPSVDVVVKILDGRTIDGHYWLHWSALTEQAFTLMVIDRLTMRSVLYEKPAGSVTAVIDKTSF
jgi:photosystem II stability/assembly factor-like uncharacterized protein